MGARSVTVTLSVDANTRGIDDYKTKMEQASNATRNMGDSANDGAGKMSLLDRAVGGFLAAVSVQKVIDFGMALNDMGVAAIGNERVFRQLIGPGEDFNDLMERLRVATLGIVDDTTLMEGSNRLMRMGLVANTDQLEEMMGMIVRLKSPTQDAGQAIEEFSLMLANQSILRLDTFGLSGARVRQRMEELKESGQGLSREQQFNIAVMEEMERAIARLGPAAEVSGTSMNRLGTDLENAMGSVGTNIAQGVEGFATGLELLLGSHPAQSAAAEAGAAAAENFMLNYRETFASFSEMAGAPLESSLFQFDPMVMEEFMGEAINRLRDNPSLRGDMSSLMRGLFADFNMADQIEFADLYAEAFEATLNLYEAESQITAENERQAQLAQARIDQTNSFLEMEREADRLATQQAQAEENRTEQRGRLADLSKLEYESMMEISRYTGEMVDTLEGLEVPEYMTQEQADRVSQMADEAARLADEIETSIDNEEGIFSEEELNAAREQADNLKDIASEAQKAADAFERMSLADVFGQTGGGLAGEISDMAIDQMKSAGMTDEQIAEYQQSFDLASGRETTGSIALEEVIIPELLRLAEDKGPEIAAAMMTNLETLLGDAALAGVDTNTEDFIGSLLGAVQGGSFAEGDFNPEEFLAPFTDASTAAESMASDMPTVQDAITTMTEEAPALGESLGKAGKEAGGLQLAIQHTATTLTQLSSKEYPIKFRTEVLDPTGILGIIKAGGLEAAIAQVVGDNGGQVPGATAA